VLQKLITSLGKITPSRFVMPTPHLVFSYKSAACSCWMIFSGNCEIAGSGGGGDGGLVAKKPSSSDVGFRKPDYKEVKLHP
jgi:hypothetical protein